MAIKKIKIGNTTHDIRDDRIVGVTSTVSPGNGSVVTSGGVYSAIQNATAIELLSINMSEYIGIQYDCIRAGASYDSWKRFCNELGFPYDSDAQSTEESIEDLFHGQNRLKEVYFRDGLGLLVNAGEYVSVSDVLANNLSYIASISIERIFSEDECSFLTFESTAHRLTLMTMYDSEHGATVYAFLLSPKKNILFFNFQKCVIWEKVNSISYRDWPTQAKQNIALRTLLALSAGVFDLLVDDNDGLFLRSSCDDDSFGCTIFEGNNYLGADVTFTLSFGYAAIDNVRCKLSDNIYDSESVYYDQSESELNDAVNSVLEAAVPIGDTVYIGGDGVSLCRFPTSEFLRLYGQFIEDYFYDRQNAFGPEIFAVFYDPYSSYWRYDDYVPDMGNFYVLVRATSNKLFWLYFDL